MAKTAFATNNALTKKAWEEVLFRDAVKESYFSRFMGKGSDSIVQVKTELEKGKGDKITFGIRLRLTGAGITGAGTLEGNEEALATHDSSVTLEQYRHAVRDDGAMTRQRAMFEIDEESRTALKDWMSERTDKLAFDTILTSPTKIFYGDGSSTATVTTAGKLTMALMSKVRTWAITGGNRAQTPLRPVKVNGKNYFVLLIHPDVAWDLKQDTTYAAAIREAAARGAENPIFTGALAIVDGIVLHEHENIPIVTNWGAGGNVPGAKCVFLGAQSLTWAWGKRPKVVTKNFDYENEHGFAIGMIAGAAKPVFNALDYGSVAVYVARTKIADA